jgi:microtubule-associated protein 1
MEDDFIGSSRASQIMRAIMAKWKAKKLGKVEFDNKRPRKVSKFIINKVIDKDERKNFKRTVKKENISYINSLYPNISRKDWKKIYNEMLKNYQQYKDSKKGKKDKTPQEKLTLEAIKEVEKDVKKELKKPDEKIKGEKKTPAKELKEISKDVSKKAVEQVIKKKIKDMTPEEKREYNRLAKQRQYQREKELKKNDPPKKKGRPKKNKKDNETEYEGDTDYETSDEEN